MDKISTKTVAEEEELNKAMGASDRNELYGLPTVSIPSSESQGRWVGPGRVFAAVNPYPTDCPWISEDASILTVPKIQLHYNSRGVGGGDAWTSSWGIVIIGRDLTVIKCRKMNKLINQ